jgi:putative ABC transport system permease protein
MMDALLQDIRYGIRQLLRNRGASAVAILTLALGIGASTAIFSVIDATMLRPLPYPNPEQLISVSVAVIQPNGRASTPTPSMADVRLFQQATDVVSHVAGWGQSFGGRIIDGPEPERVRVAQFTEDYLPMHGVAPLIGRDFTIADMQFGAPPVVMLGYGYWQSRFGGRDNALGETVRLDDGPATIVGVLPPSFNRTTPLARPLRVEPARFERRGTGSVSIQARLKPGVTIEQATARLSALLAGASGGGATPPTARITSRLGSAIDSARTTVNVMSGAVALILLIACVNVAGLFLARGASRQSELAVRASLGAGRLRLMRQLLTEGTLVAFAGGAVGVALAWLSLDAIVANIPLSMPANSPVRINLTVLLATVALLVPTVLVFGLVPAERLSKVQLVTALGGSRYTGASLTQRGGQLLIAGEVALAIVLVTGAGLMIRSFVRLSATDLGFNPDGLLTMEVLPLDREVGVHKTFYPALLQRVRTIPGVQSASIVNNFPLGSGTSFTGLRGSGDEVFSSTFKALPGYFETIGAHLRAGRFPGDADTGPGFRGVILNEPAARVLFPDGPAVDRQISYTAGKDLAPWTVLGVIADLRHGGPLGYRSENFPQVFFPFDVNEYEVAQAMVVVARTSDSTALGDHLRQAARSIGPRVLVERIRTANDRFGEGVITPRRRTVLLSLLGSLGLLLSLVGVFGMTGYAVSRRTTEIGVRMAFGAQPAQVVRTIVRDAMIPIVAGTVIGLGAAVVAARVIESFLFKTATNDAFTYASVAAVLIVTGCLAALIPALRAARVDPVETLRAQ